jgi:hypothetical protein
MDFFASTDFIGARPDNFSDFLISFRTVLSHYEANCPVSTHKAPQYTSASAPFRCSEVFRLETDIGPSKAQSQAELVCRYIKMAAREFIPRRHRLIYQTYDLTKLALV